MSEPEPNEFLRVEDAIKNGVLDVETMKLASGLRDPVYVDAEGTAFPDWWTYRVNLTEDYLGIPPERKSVKTRDYPLKSRKQTIELAHNPDEGYERYLAANPKASE